MSRIDTPIRSTSHWRQLYAAGYIVCSLLMALILAMPWWGIAMLGVSSVLICGLRLWLHQPPHHLSSADDTLKTSYWQLMYDDRGGPVLWEAELIDIQSFAHFIQFKFQTVHPLIKHKRVLIWQDQVDAQKWRQLKVLSRWQS